MFNGEMLKTFPLRLEIKQRVLALTISIQLHAGSK